MKKAKVSNTFIVIDLFLCLIILTTTLLKMETVASLAFYISFFLMIVELMKIFQVRDNIFIMMLIILIFAAINIFLNLCVNDAWGAIGITYFIKYLIFASTIIFLYLCTIIPIDEKLSRTLIILSSFIGCIFIIFYFLFGERTSVGITTRHLTMNFSNPNLLGIWLLQFVLYSIVALFRVKKGKRIHKTFLLFEIGALSYLIFKTGCRTALICEFIFILLLLLRKFWAKKYLIKKWIIWLILLTPLIFVALYMTNLQFFQKTFSFLASEGKELDSRLSTWDSAIYFFKQNIITGSYYEASGGSGKFQMHNSLLDILSAYGVIVCALILIYVYMIIQKIQKGVKNYYQTIALIAFFIVWIMGLGEAALFSGGQGIYIVSCSFLLLAREQDVNQEMPIQLGEKK